MAFPAPKTPVYRKTKSGDYVIFGPESFITVGPVTVTLRSGATQKTHILSVGAVFDVEGTPCRYGYQTVALTEAPDTAAALGAGKPTASRTATVSLDASDFAPDSAYAGEDDVPPSYDEFTGEYDMPPSTEAFTEQFA